MKLQNDITANCLQRNQQAQGDHYYQRGVRYLGKHNRRAKLTLLRHLSGYSPDDNRFE